MSVAVTVRPNISTDFTETYLPEFSSFMGMLVKGNISTVPFLPYDMADRNICHRLNLRAALSAWKFHRLNYELTISYAKPPSIPPTWRIGVLGSSIKALLNTSAPDLNCCFRMALSNFMIDFKHYFLVSYEKCSATIEFSCVAISEKSRFKSSVFTLILFPLIW